MVNTKVKKSVSTLTDLVVILLLVIGLFTSCFIWLQTNANDAGLTIDSKYNTTYTRLNEARDEIDDNVQNIKTATDNIREAENTYQVAWNGLKGLGSALKLPISFVSTAEKTYEAISISLDVIPTWESEVFSNSA